MESFIIINKETLECLTYYKGEINFSKTTCSKLCYEKARLIHESLFRKYNYFILKLKEEDYKDLERLLTSYRNNDVDSKTKPNETKDSIKSKIEKYALKGCYQLDNVVTYINKLHDF